MNSQWKPGRLYLGQAAFRVLYIGLFLGLVPETGRTAEIRILGGNETRETFLARALEPGSIIDARGAEFRVANSRNAQPHEGADCETGERPVNPYPVRIYDSAAVSLIGGLFDGDVPQEADWIHTYCNSTAVGVWNSPDALLDGQRMRRVWDGLRLAEDSQSFRIERAWLSEVRDDCVENDFRLSGTIADSLFDGCFVGLSMRAPGETPGDASDHVTLDGVLMRLQPYPYRGELKQGFPLKLDAAAPSIAIHDSVIAIESVEMISPSSVGEAWDKVGTCEGNLFLWMSDDPWSDYLPLPPPCFRVLHGAEAREAWDAARRNWIDCHPDAARFAGDTASTPDRCDRAAFGGGE